MSEYEYVYLVLDKCHIESYRVMAVHKTKVGAEEYRQRLEETFPNMVMEIERRIVWN